MKKKQNLNPARNMDVDAWRARQIRKRLAACLEQREQRFIREHGGDTDEELRKYVLGVARSMGRMPHPLELEGGEYLRKRLGDWQQLARRLGCRPAEKRRGQQAYQQLKRREEEAFLAERRAVKEARKRQSPDRAGHSPAPAQKPM